MNWRYHNAELTIGGSGFRPQTRSISRIILWWYDKNRRSSDVDKRRYSTPSNCSTFCWSSPRAQYAMTSCDRASWRAISSITKSPEAPRLVKDTGGRILLIGIKMTAILSLVFDCPVAIRVTLKISFRVHLISFHYGTFGSLPYFAPFDDFWGSALGHAEARDRFPSIVRSTSIFAPTPHRSPFRAPTQAPPILAGRCRSFNMPG